MITLKSGEKRGLDVSLTPILNIPYISQISPTVCPYYGTIEIYGSNLDSGAWLVKCYFEKGVKFVSTYPRTKTSTKLVVDLSLSVTEGNWIVYVGVIRSQGESELYSNEVSLTVT